MRIFIWLLASVGAVALGFAGVLAYGFITATGGFGPERVDRALDEAEIFALSTIEAYGENWDEAALIGRASAEFAAAVGDGAALSTMSETLRGVAGPLTSIGEASCPDWRTVNDGTGGARFVAGCLVEGEAARAALGFRVNAVRPRGGEWRLLGFFVEFLAVNETERAIEVNAVIEPGGHQRRLSFPEIGQPGVVSGPRAGIDGDLALVVGTGGVSIGEGTVPAAGAGLTVGGGE